MDACCLGTVLGGTYREILWWQTLFGHLRMIKTFQMLCDEIGLLVSQVMQSHSTKLRMEEFIHKMRFHLPLSALTIFRTNQKPPQVSLLFCKLMRCFKMCIKNRVRVGLLRLRNFPCGNFEWLKSAVCGIIADSPLYIYIYIYIYIYTMLRCKEFRNRN